MSVRSVINTISYESSAPDFLKEISWRTYRHLLAREVMVDGHAKYAPTVTPVVPSMEPSGLAQQTINNNIGSHLTPIESPIPGLLLHPTLSIQKDKVGDVNVCFGVDPLRFDRMMARVNHWKKEINLRTMKDNGEEHCLENWICEDIVRSILDFLKFYFIGLLRSASVEGSVEQFLS
ncbi:hypothetical protein BJ165DRAFT_123296 [Panaeolus papilionaceus]|nr:hypothetical protein BJ165DRAFT_123296 [Panaeolus papilionaceus]